MTLSDEEDGLPNVVPNTRPDASAEPFPPLDALPSEESPTEPAPDDIKSLLTRLLDEQNAGFSLVFERVGELRTDVASLAADVARIEAVQERYAVDADKRADSLIRACRAAADGALEAAARVEALRQSIDLQFGTGRLAVDELPTDERVEASAR